MTRHRHPIPYLCLSFAVACSGAGLVPAAAAAQAAASDSGPPRSDLPRVIVSAREVRVIFPRVAASWEGRRDIPLAELIAAYGWQLQVDGVERPVAILLGSADTDSGGRTFATLETFLAAARTSTCRSAGWMFACNGDSTFAAVRNGRVMLIVRDSMRIADMFGLRPEHALAVRPRSPGAPLQLLPDTTRIEYIEPAIPMPEDALLQRSARAWEEYHSSINSIHREMTRVDVGLAPGPQWLAVGDTASLAALEMRCRFDTCTSFTTIADSGWTVDDSSIAVLREFADERSRRMPLFRIASVRLLGLREGRTIVRVRGLPAEREGTATLSSVPRSLDRELIVTHPVGRIELSVSRDTVRVGESVMISARVFDVHGTPLTGVPLGRWATKGLYKRAYASSERGELIPDQPGDWTIGAALGGTQTTTVLVVLPVGGR